MSVPTEGEEFSKLIEYLRKAQETSAMLGHLAKAHGEDTRSHGWLGISELIARMVVQVTKLATRKLQ